MKEGMFLPPEKWQKEIPAVPMETHDFFPEQTTRKKIAEHYDHDAG